MKLLAGNSNPPLARSIADYLEVPLTEASVRRFADEEIFVEVNENVRGEALERRLVTIEALRLSMFLVG